MSRPSAVVLARRRQLLLWLPLFVLGVVAYLVAAHLTLTLNGLGLLGMLLTVGSAAGLISEIGK